MTERAVKRAIRSYGIISILEEKIEYVGAAGPGLDNSDTTNDTSFVLFDASKGEQLIVND